MNHHRVLFAPLLELSTDPASAAASQANKEEVDSRSAFVGNVSSIILFQFLICY